jgi:magnesium chelatase subunit I
LNLRRYVAAFRTGKPIESVKMRIPMVEVPLGTTEDRICGTIDIEKALAEVGGCTS